MKATGIVRRIDDLGRIVIPMELRRVMDIKEGDPLEIFTGDEGIILQNYEGDTPKCAICGTSEGLKKINGKYICRACAIQAYAATREA